MEIFASDNYRINNIDNPFLVQKAFAQPTTISSNTTNMTATNADAEDVILRQGIISSSQARQNETGQIAIILPHRSDEKLYTGVLTFSASGPVEVALLHRISMDNNTLSQIDFQK